MDGMAASAMGILYAEDFDDPNLPPMPDPEPAAPSFTLDDLEAAKRMARDDATAAARVEWERSSLQARTQSLAAIATAVADARHEAAALTDTVAGGTASTILAMVAGVLPDLCALHGGAETRAMLRHLLPTLAQQPRIVVRVAPAILDDVRADLALLDEELAATITLTAAVLAPGDARVSWIDGSLIRDQTAIRAAITAALTELGLLEPAAAPTEHATDPRRMAYAQ